MDHIQPLDFTVFSAIFMLETGNSAKIKLHYSRKNEDAETSSFPKLPLEKSMQVVYNQCRR